MEAGRKSLYLVTLVCAGLFVLQFVLPEYHHLIATRIMVLAIFATAFNILFGYTGLLSLGHAMFFAAGLYTAGMVSYYLEWSAPLALLCALLVGAAVSMVIGWVALRTTGVAFMIVTMMFAQVAYLASLYFTTYTRGDEGLVLPESTRSFSIGDMVVDLTDPATRYFIALAFLAITLGLVYRLIHSPTGRAMVAVRENETRTRMLGYNTFAIKWWALVYSGTLSAMAGALYALLFAYVGSSFATIQYSIDALLFTLLGGAGTLLGPLLGSFVMFYLVDTASDFTAAYLLVTGIALVLLVLFFPKGILGTIRQRYLPWLS